MSTYKTPDEIADQYLLYLKNLKPEINTDQTDSDWWIRSRVVGGVVAGVYADQLKVSNDAFPQSARREALERHLYTYFGSGFRDATQAVGNVLATAAATGATIPAGTQFQYAANGNVYTADESIVFSDAVTAIVPVTSVSTGQNQNLLEGATLSLPSPPAGITSTATVYGGPISDGRNVESNPEAAARILRQIRTPLAGGKVSDYEQFAFDADSSVTSATVSRYPFGLGTVGVVITAGTTDIDQALENDEPIVLIPSDELVQTVQDYIETVNPVTDCVYVFKPTSISIDVTVNVRFAQGDGSTILSGQTLTQSELVQREIKRAIYKTPPGGRKLGASGYVVGSEIEELIDYNLSASPYTVGALAQIVIDRNVEDLSVTGINRLIAGTEVAVPGVITINVLS
jgi:uncharacterized phage protein gp47/JayE